MKILGSVFLIGLPLFIFSLFGGCLSFDGFAFWILLPVPGIFFGASIGRVFKLLNFRAPTFFTILTLLFTGLLIWIIEFFTLPQVYFFNHVWGIWPGPIYDETLTVSGNLLFFRSITGLWIILLWILPEWSKNLQNKLIFGFTVISLMFCYLNLDEAGIITPREVLKEKLSLNIKTSHFDLYFDPTNFSEDEAEYWALKHEFYFDQIIEKLEVKWPENRTIESFLYSNAWQKKKLVGAKFTSYVPIWLEQDQLHIAKQQLEGVLQHELVHAISKQFGNKLYNGSSSIGLIEGIAEAIAKDASRESTLDQIIAAEKKYPDSEQMKHALSNTGFYSASSAISYTTAGSFIKYLIDNYPVQFFKDAYPNGDFNSSYPVSFDVLVSQWHHHLDSVLVDSLDQNISEFIFSRRSLFQKKCPHSFDKEYDLWDEFNRHQSLGDSIGALKIIDQLYQLNPENKLIKRDWIQKQLLGKNYQSVLTSFDNSDTLLTLKLLKADALFMTMNVDEAQRYINSLKPEIELNNARNFKYSYQLRSDSLNHDAFLSARYKNELPSLATFADLKIPVQMLVLSKAIELRSFDYLANSISSISKKEFNTHWFDVYENIIQQLVFTHDFEHADMMIQKIESLSLRRRYKERLSELKEWRNFVLSEIDN